MIGPKITVTIQSLSQAPTATGALADTWTTLAVVIAVLSQKSEKEKIANGKGEFTSDYTLWITPVAGMTEKHRVQYADPFLGITRNFKIVAINNAMQKNRIWELDLLEIR